MNSITLELISFGYFVLFVGGFIGAVGAGFLLYFIWNNNGAVDGC